MNSSRGIPTLYAGVEFRSRAEARWAAFFDIVRWPWIYEPFDEDGYIPDFVLRFKREPVLVEVKGGCTEYVELEDHVAKLETAARRRGSVHALMLAAAPMNVDSEWELSIGMLGQLVDERQGFSWDAARVNGPCGSHRVSIYHGLLSYHCVACGVYNGGSGPHYDGDMRDIVVNAWAEASNRTKWRRWSA